MVTSFSAEVDVKSYSTSPEYGHHKDYKVLINKISEKLLRRDAIQLGYDHNIPKWYSEVGNDSQDAIYTHRVLSYMEGKDIISPTNVRELVRFLNKIDQKELLQLTVDFEKKHITDDCGKANKNLPIACEEDVRIDRPLPTQKSAENIRARFLPSMKRSRSDETPLSFSTRKPIIANTKTGAMWSNSNSPSDLLLGTSPPVCFSQSPVALGQPDLSLTDYHSTHFLKQLQAQFTISHAVAYANLIKDFIKPVMQDDADLQLHENLTNAYFKIQEVISSLNEASNNLAIHNNPSSFNNARTNVASQPISIPPRTNISPLHSGVSVITASQESTSEHELSISMEKQRVADHQDSSRDDSTTKKTKKPIPFRIFK